MIKRMNILVMLLKVDPVDESRFYLFMLLFNYPNLNSQCSYHNIIYNFKYLIM